MGSHIPAPFRLFQSAQNQVDVPMIRQHVGILPCLADSTLTLMHFHPSPRLLCPDPTSSTLPECYAFSNP
jgi:hypothetical protein